MPPGTRKRKTSAEKYRYQTQRRVQMEPAHGQVKQPLYQGILNELVKPVGRNPLTVWMLGWRCKRCSHVWPVRRFKHTTGPHAGEYFEPHARGGEPGQTPKSCPGCDSKDWWKDYREPLSGPRRAGRRRVPYMLKSYQSQHQAEQPQTEAAAEETPES